MKKIYSLLFSMQFTALVLIIFGYAIGKATFIERDYGTIAAKAVVYNAAWFEILLIVIMINLIGSIFKHNMLRKEKLTILTFHIAFIVMIIGAGITRFISYEGLMSIREGKESSYMITSKSYLNIDLTKGTETVSKNKELFLNGLRNKKFKEELKIGDQIVKIKYVDFIPAAMEQVVSDSAGDMILSMAIFDGTKRSDVFIKNKEIKNIGDLKFSLNNNSDSSAIQINYVKGQLLIYAPVPVSYFKMLEQKEGTIPADSQALLEQRVLYQIQNSKLVIKEIHMKASTSLVKSEASENANLADALIVNVSAGEVSKQLTIFGKHGNVGRTVSTNISGTDISLSYGSIYLNLPFSIFLKDFQLERYPGSKSPSSYESEVIVKDPGKNIEMPYRIYMNHILNYRGFRFFQSSYDPDERGTVLSVNHDGWGTGVTYLSYILLALGLFLTLFNKSSRFRAILKTSVNIRNARKNGGIAVLMTFLFFGLSFHSNAQDATHVSIDAEHAKKFGSLLVQDPSGRIEPINTLSSEILRKISRRTSFQGLTPDQVFLDMMTDPVYWQNQKIIRVSNEELQNFLGIDEKYAAFNDIVNFKVSDGYKLSALVNEANQKKPQARSKFDKEVLHVDERINICYYVFTGAFFNSFPQKNDPNNSWVSPDEFTKTFRSSDSAQVFQLLKNYLNAISEAKESKNWGEADKQLLALSKFQKETGHKVIPPDSKTKLEIRYNEIAIFIKLGRWYTYVGIILLLLSFLSILIPKLPLKWPFRIIAWILGLLFLSHTVGLAARWYISGHAPWSNSYETLIFIAWGAILAGIIFSGKSRITLTATALLAASLLSVAHLSWMDPEITNLVPVLKSYWLIIHVATITLSYAFLGLGAIVSFFALIIMILKSKRNRQYIDLTISEFTIVSEATLQIGLILLTIGTFLGGVWANESWGRYWGWDPKETWSLITILVYSFILHARFIPGLRGPYAFNLMTVFGFGSVIMTYFGVNYYLSGLHSYAKGEPTPFPTFGYYTIATILVIGILAFINHSRLEHIKNKKTKEVNAQE